MTMTKTSWTLTTKYAGRRTCVRGVYSGGTLYLTKRQLKTARERACLIGGDYFVSARRAADGELTYSIVEA